MPDRTFLSWPFFDDAHRDLARQAADWWRREGAALPRADGTGAAAEHGGAGATDAIDAAGQHDNHGEGLDAWEACRVIVRRLGEGGWLRHALAHEDAALDVGPLCVLRETFAYGSGLADFAFALQGLGSGPISLFGSAEQRRAWLPRV